MRLKKLEWRERDRLDIAPASPLKDLWICPPAPSLALLADCLCVAVAPGVSALAASTMGKQKWLG